MMAFTHLFGSLAVATAVAPAVSEVVAPPLVFLAAVVGGLAPDLDLLAHHRRTLHYPVGFPLLTVAAGAGAGATGSGITVLVAVCFAAAALHCLADLLGGSAERAPWDPVTEFGVYNHVLGRWHRPLRLVQYSGSPGDLLVGTALAVVVAVSSATPPAADAALVALVAAAAGYTLSRRRLPALAAWLSARLPSQVRRAVPVLRVEEREGGGTTVSIRLNR
jgi:hypothetical protein